jgi:hypothetical protein
MQFSLKWVTGIFVECVVESGRILVETTKTKSREVGERGREAVSERGREAVSN